MEQPSSSYGAVLDWPQISVSYFFLAEPKIIWDKKKIGNFAFSPPPYFQHPNKTDAGPLSGICGEQSYMLHSISCIWHRRNISEYQITFSCFVLFYLFTSTINKIYYKHATLLLLLFLMTPT